MGLDQWAYCRPPRKRNSDEDEHLEEWRKHNRLQGYGGTMGIERMSRAKVHMQKTMMKTKKMIMIHSVVVSMALSCN